MKRIVLHIGSAKCGSSSLQNFFSYNFTSPRPHRNDNGQTVAYAAITKNHLLVGDELLQLAERSPFQSVASVPLRSVKKEVLDARISELVLFSKNIDIIILSCEGWAQEAYHANASAFQKLGVPIDFIFVTRPPVDLLNSGWWQWGAWSGLSVENWCKQNIGIAKFFDALSGWNSLYPRSEKKLIDLSQDPVHQAIRFLGFEPNNFPKSKVVNRATNADLLKHLIRNRYIYGRGVHKPGIEFYLNSILNLTEKRPPHVISLEVAKYIISECSDSSRRILNLLSEQGDTDKDLLSRYLDGEFYSKMTTVDYNEWISNGNAYALVREIISRIYQRNKN